VEREPEIQRHPGQEGYIMLNPESVPDYMQLMKEYEKLEKSRLSRPRTAFAPSSQPEYDI
jgi:hypothetical protein